MIERRHTAEDGTRSKALFSECGLYRYALSRIWGHGPEIAFLMLNPSTADERANDPTIARCETRARAWGFAGLHIVNLFAFRATDPKDLKAATDPVGPDNQRIVCEIVAQANLTLAAWGVHGTHLSQDDVVLDWLAAQPLACLGQTKLGHPRHPLYISYAKTPEPWRNMTKAPSLPNDPSAR